LFWAITHADLILRIAFFFFFTWQGRVYALTILGNFLVGIPKLHRSETPATHGNFSTVVFHVPDDALPPKPPRAIQDGGWFATGDLALYEVSKVRSRIVVALILGIVEPRPCIAPSRGPSVREPEWRAGLGLGPKLNATRDADGEHCRDRLIFYARKKFFLLRRR
jgi:hypothetical protein